MEPYDFGRRAFKVGIMFISSDRDFALALRGKSIKERERWIEEWKRGFIDASREKLGGKPPS